MKNKTLEDTDKATAGGPHAEWGVWEFGYYLAGEAFCVDDVDDNGYLWCHGSPLMIFNINLHSGRFLRTYAGFYAVDDTSVYAEEHADKPVIEIGKCTAL